MKDMKEIRTQLIQRQVMLEDNTWVSTYYNGQYMDSLHEENLDKWTGVYPYIYILGGSGKVQQCMATITVERSTWQMPEGATKVTTDIQVSFSEELGSDAGSWKGGTIGCNYEMNEGETPHDTLRRMEKERTF